MSDLRLAFGCTKALPDGTTTAWGARLIYPNDLVHDRQDLKGPDADDLKAWLNGGPLRSALDAARSHRDLDPTKDVTVTLFEDEDGIIVGNPQASHGYLYVAAWLKGGDDAR
jgi:hypothetical protein